MPRNALVALVFVACTSVARAAGPLPPLPPPNPDCTLFGMASGDNCDYGTPTVIETTVANPKFTISNSVGEVSFTQAVSCGDLACVYRGVGWRLFGSGLSTDPDGECTTYGGIESAGAFTRPLLGTPGRCDLRYDPSDFDLRSPGQWKRVNFFLVQGSFPQDGISYLVGVRPELFKLTVHTADPVDKRSAAGVIAVRQGTDPAASACVNPVAWLPNRVAPACVVFDKSGKDFSNYLPNGQWDLYTFDILLPFGSAKVRQEPTPWPKRAVTIADADVEIDVERIPRPRVNVTIELLGGDDLLFVDETGTVRVTLTTTSQDVAGTVDEINFYPATTKVVQLQRPTDGGVAEITGDATPVPPGAGFSMGPGEVRTFDVPILGTGAGPMNLRVTVDATTEFFDNRDASATKTIQIIPVGTVTTTTLPPSSACGNSILTFVRQTTTGSALPVTSADGIALGDELIVDPCTENAEQVAVAAIAGNVLSVAPALAKLHVTNEPIVRADPNGSMLKSPASAGDTELDVIDSSVFTIGDAVLIDPGTSIEERRLVTGFGSIIVDEPLAHDHGVATAVVLEVPKTSTTTTLPGGGTTTTTLPGSSCTPGATLDSVACRLAALVAQTGGLAAGKPRTQLLAKANAAASAVEKARGLLDAGKKKPARAALKKAAKAVRAFGKKLRSKKIAKALSEEERARLAEPLVALASDLKALARTPGG